jgi:hypothetical protein
MRPEEYSVRSADPLYLCSNTAKLIAPPRPQLHQRKQASSFKRYRAHLSKGQGPYGFSFQEMGSEWLMEYLPPLKPLGING